MYFIKLSFFFNYQQKYNFVVQYIYANSLYISAKRTIDLYTGMSQFSVINEVENSVT